MNSSVTSGRCPTCGAELPGNAPQGLCPKCLLMGVAAPTQAGPTADQRPAAPALEAVRAAFPQLEILELIGQGGMGSVFKACQPKLNRFVALKILPKSLARDPAFAERLAREGQGHKAECGASPCMSQPFRTTQWTRVLAARGDNPESRQALSELCAAYYEPVVAFLSRFCRYEEQARELAHEFFARILARQSLDGADPRRGRFRTYLHGAVKHFLANQRAAASCEKRGTKAVHEPIAAGMDTSPGREIPDSGALPADEWFDREWALNVLDRGLAALEEEALAADARLQFQALKPWLTGDRPDLTQGDAARALGMSEGAVRVAIYRLRKRFRELVKLEIAQTVDPPATVEEELRYLISVLSHPAPSMH